MTALILRPPRPRMGTLRMKQSYQTTLALAMVAAVVLHFALVGVAQLMISQLSASTVAPAFVRVIPRYDQLLNSGFTETMTARTKEFGALPSNLRFFEGLWVPQYQGSMVRGLTVLPHHRFTDWCAHICVSHRISPPTQSSPVWFRKTVPEFL